MPEGKGEMPSSPETPRPTPLSRETRLTLSFAKLPFNEIIAQERKLENLLQSQEIQTNEERKNKVASSLEAVTRRRDKLVADFRNSGKLDPVDRKLEALRQMGDRFAPEVLREELNLADTMDERNGIPRVDKHYGVLGWYYGEELEKLRIERQSASSADSSQDRKGSPDSSANIDSVSEATRRRIEEIMQVLNSGNASPEEQARLGGELRTLLEQQAQVLRRAIVDPETGMRGGVESLPDAREVGADEVRRLFKERLRTLVEEQADQSFDQNWRLVYPLELTIMSLMPRRGEPDQVGPENVKFSLSGLRRELSTELQAYRNVHNFIYIYRRVGGVTHLIEAASLLPRETINLLLKTSKVADRLRKIEALGERNLALKTKEYQGVTLTEAEKGELKKNEATVKELMVKSSTKEEFEGDFWANRIAGGLYSGLHESARHDMQVNESGDFFSDRLFHTKERAKDMWERTWGRKSRPDLYEAVDLRLTGFWEEVLGSKIGSFKTISDAQKYCKSQGIEAVIDEEVDEETGRRKIILVSFNLSKAKFEEMSFSEAGSGLSFAVKTDEVRQVNLDLDDADKIRKAIFDPRGFLDEPSMATIKKAYEVFKHLKGKTRSGWVRNVCREVVLLYRDTVHPGNESASPRSRKCPGQEIYPEMVPWTNNEVANQLTRMTPPLTDVDREKVLKEFVGTKAERRLKEDVQVAKEVGKSMLGEFLKALFGLK